MTPCVRLHLIPGSHAPGCTCTRDCRDHDGHCTGCLPAEATRGLLCDTDSRRLRGHLGAEQGLDPTHPVHGLPWAWENLEHAMPSLSQAPSSGGSSVDDAEAQRLTAVVSLRDDIHDTLVSWGRAVQDHTGLAGPIIPDWTAGMDRAARQRIRVRHWASWLLAAIESLEAGPADEPPAPEIEDVSEWMDDQVGRWHDGAGGSWPLHTWLALTWSEYGRWVETCALPGGYPRIRSWDTAAASAVRSVLEELGDLMSRAHDLAPWRPAPTHVDGIPCRCGAFDLHDHSDLVKCWSCGFTMDRDKYRVLTKVYARRFGDDPRGMGATETPKLVKIQEVEQVVDLRRELARIEAELEDLKAAGLETLEAAARWSELVARHERIRAALEPAVAGHGGRA